MAAAATARARRSPAPVTPSPRPRRVINDAPVYSVQRNDNSRVRRVADAGQVRSLLLTVMIGVLVCGGLLAVAWEQWALISQGYAISDLKHKRDELTEANQALQLKVVELRNPRNLNDAAARLGLTQPAEGQVVRMANPLPQSDGGPVLARMHPLVSKP